MFGNSVFALNPVAFTIFGKDIYWYSIILTVAVITTLLLAIHFGKKKGYSDEVFIDLCFVILIPGIIGARLLYVILNFSQYQDNLIEILYIWKGGLAILGGFILAFPAFLIYCKKKKLNAWEILDIIVPCLAIGQEIGRWGNFTNQEAYGLAVTNEAFQFFPVAIFIDRDSTWHLATFFYESIWSLFTFFVLMKVDKVKKKAGDVFLLYLMMYAFIRIVLEFLRVDGKVGNQIIAAVLLFAALIVYMVRRKIEKDAKFNAKFRSKFRKHEFAFDDEDSDNESFSQQQTDSSEELGTEDTPEEIQGEDKES